MIDASLLGAINTLTGLSPLFSSGVSPTFANPATLASNAASALGAQRGFPSQQAVALSGLLSQALALQTATAPLAFDNLANSFLLQWNSPMVLQPYAQTSATSSNTAAVTATSAAGATLASYQVGVNSLGVAQVNAGNSGPSGGGSPIGGGQGTIDVSINGQAPVAVHYTILAGFDRQDALTAVADALNSANLGLTASVATSGGKSQLIVAAQEVGTVSAFTLTDVSNNAVARAGIGAATTAAQDTLYTVNGVAYDLNSGASASLDRGKLTLSFLAATTPVTVAVSANESSLAGLASNVVNAYNAFHDFLGSNASTLSPLLRQQAQQLVQRQAAGLAALGITQKADGSLAVNQTTLAHVAQSDPAAVQAAFSGASGLATTLGALGAEVGVSAQNLFAAATPPGIDTSTLPSRLAELFGAILVSGQLAGGHNVNLQG